MRNFRSWIGLCAALALAACAAAGPLYGPAQSNLSSSLGYRDQELSTGAYQVSFVAPESDKSIGRTELRNSACRRPNLSQGAHLVQAPNGDDPEGGSPAAHTKATTDHRSDDMQCRQDPRRHGLLLC